MGRNWVPLKYIKKGEAPRMYCLIGFMNHGMCLSQLLFKPPYDYILNFCDRMSYNVSLLTNPTHHLSVT